MLLTKRITVVTTALLFGFNFLLKAQELETALEAVFNDFELMGMAVHVSTADASNTYNFGLRDFNRNLPVTNDTQFRIASISKAVTALGVMKLYNQGSIDLDEDISTYLGYQVRNPNFPEIIITARMLLSHQSSLQDGGGYNSFLNATFSQSPIPNVSELIVPGGNFYTSNMWRTETPSSYFVYSNLNYGVLGTLIEAISNQRFDVYMKTEILEPLGILGSFNVQDLNNIDNVSVLYRYQGGAWQPQWDHYQGIMPPPPDLSGYTLGTNGLYFAPQGGLRCTAEDLSRFLTFLTTDGLNSTLNIAPEIIQEMKAIAWDYNGGNGDTYGGLFNRWGLGLHHVNVYPGDAICPVQDVGTFIGHAGEAYGLVSDAFFSTDQEIQFSLLINGSRNGYQTGATSFYTVEEAVFESLCTYFDNILTIDDIAVNSVFSVNPNPAHTAITIEQSQGIAYSASLFTIEGKALKHTGQQHGNTSIDVSYLQAGVYFLKISTQKETLTKKIIVE